MVNVRLADGGVIADIHADLPEVMKLDAGHGMKASIGFVNGHAVVRSIEMSEDVSISGAKFAAQAAVERQRKGKCPICRKAEEILKKRGK